MKVESFARELCGTFGVGEGLGVECALENYLEGAAEKMQEGGESPRKQIIVGEGEVKKSGLRGLPTPVRVSIRDFKRNVLPSYTPAKAKKTEGTPPPTPNYGDDLMVMFEQRPEDVLLVSDYASDFHGKAGVEEEKAYGFALDAYLEGVGEFWQRVEGIDEEGVDEEEEVEEETEEVEDEEVEEEEEVRMKAAHRIAPLFTLHWTLVHTALVPRNPP